MEIPANEVITATICIFAGYLRTAGLLQRISRNWRRLVEVLCTLVLSALGVALIVTTNNQWSWENTAAIFVQWGAASVPVGIVFGIKRRGERNTVKVN